ncbi:MAG: hypothetical protein LBH37_03880 [Oscillospiraceae bacterium]|jgi:predicted amidophosphoribosyltransferase|nr:hypothetical protein [Oscillospiraceae bacterium]
MVSFSGASCPECKVKFQDLDDIVVCPECGAPYHRQCYEKVGHCLFEEKHKDKFKWKSRSAHRQTGTLEDVICPSCGHKNPHNATYCEDCKSRITKRRGEFGSTQKLSQKEVFNNSNSALFAKASFSAEPLLGFNPKEEIDGVEAKDIAKYVQNNPNYYLNAFRLMKQKNKGRFNFSAFLFSGAWLLYRKQYKIGAVVSAVSMLISTIALWVNSYCSEIIYNDVLKSFNLPPDSFVPLEKLPEFQEKLFLLPTGNVILFFLPNLLMILDFCIMVVCGFKGNKIYMSDCFLKINKIKKESKSEEELDQKFLLEGGVNYHIVWGFALIMLLLRLIPFM